jgi:hypothetical protein
MPPSGAKNILAGLHLGQTSAFDVFSRQYSRYHGPISSGCIHHREGLVHP